MPVTRSTQPLSKAFAPFAPVSEPTGDGQINAGIDAAQEPQDDRQFAEASEGGHPLSWWERGF